MIGPWVRVSGDVPTRVAAVLEALAGVEPLASFGAGAEVELRAEVQPSAGVPLLLQVVGGESTGKSTLCAALGEALPAVVVPEALRAWVEAHGRVPDAAEQWEVIRAQAAAEDAALAGAPRWLVSDGGVLMTAVYSLLYYDDASLLPAAAELSARYALTIWCDEDIPWQADPQRDGPDHRAAAQEIIAEALR